MKKFLILLACFAAITAATAQTQTKTFKLSDFTAVNVTGMPDVECVKDASQTGKVVVTATNVPMDRIEVTNDNGTLTVGIKKDTNLSGFKSHKVKAVAYYARYIDNADVKGSGSVKANTFSNTSGDVILKINGSGDIEANNVLATNAKLTVNGSGDIKVTTSLKTTQAAISVNGSGDIDIASIKASKVNAAVNGSGDLDIDNCETSELKANVNGSGDLEIEKVIKATAVSAGVTGSGDLKISGSTSTASYSATGSGSVDCGKLKAGTVSMSATGSGDIYYYGNANVTSTSGKAKNMHPVK